MTGKIENIKAGESLPFTFSRGGESLAGWVLTISVIRFTGDTSLITPRVIIVVGTNWPSFLTQAETTGLSTGLHYIIGKLVKSSTDEEEVEKLRFNVQEALV